MLCISTASYQKTHLLVLGSAGGAARLQQSWPEHATGLWWWHRPELAAGLCQRLIRNSAASAHLIHATAATPADTAAAATTVCVQCTGELPGPSSQSSIVRHLWSPAVWCSLWWASCSYTTGVWNPDEPGTLHPTAAACVRSTGTSHQLACCAAVTGCAAASV